MGICDSAIPPDVIIASHMCVDRPSVNCVCFVNLIFLF